APGGIPEKCEAHAEGRPPGPDGALYRASADDADEDFQSGPPGFGSAHHPAEALWRAGPYFDRVGRGEERCRNRSRVAGTDRSAPAHLSQDLSVASVAGALLLALPRRGC